MKGRHDDDDDGLHGRSSSTDDGKTIFTLQKIIVGTSSRLLLSSFEAARIDKLPGSIWRRLCVNLQSISAGHVAAVDDGGQPSAIVSGRHGKTPSTQEFSEFS